MSAYPKNAIEPYGNSEAVALPGCLFGKSGSYVTTELAAFKLLKIGKEPWR